MAIKKDNVTGKWFCYGKYKTLTGQVKQYKKRGYSTKKEAKEAEHIFLMSNKETSNKMTLNEIYEEYLQFSSGRKKETTIVKDKQSYRLYIKEPFGDRELKSITVKDIIRFQHDLNKKGLNNKYINHIFKIFNKFYSYANKMYMISYNPISLVGRLQEERREYLTWELKEFNHFITFVEEDKYRLAFTMLYMTGMRRGELLALQWNDYLAPSVKISKTCAQTSGGYAITPPKTKNSYRSVELDETTNKMLKDWYNYVKTADGFNKSWYIFGEEHPLSFNVLGKQKVKYEKISGIKHIRIHDFRHSHVSLLINNNMPLPAIAQRVGDNIETILKTYSHLFETSNVEVMNFLNKL